MSYEGVIIKQVETEQPRDIGATMRYMLDLKNNGHKLAYDQHGSLSGSMNCISIDRKGQLREFDQYLRLHGNPRSRQAASHQLISYPEGVIPTRKQIERDLRVVLKKYGMDNQPLVWDAHGNTDNFHVHFLLLRVSLVPDEEGKYSIADDGLVKKTTKEKTGKKRVRTRTDWSACRQAAVAEISKLYGIGIPLNVRRTPDGRLRQRATPRDMMSDKTRIGERKTGKKSPERQLAEYGKWVFDSSQTWFEIDRKLAAKSIEIIFKTDAGKILGAVLQGPDGRKVSCSKLGEEYGYPSLEKKFGIPNPADATKSVKVFIPMEYRDEYTIEAAKKILKPIFAEAVEGKDWQRFLYLPHGMALRRSGGGLVVVFNGGRDQVKTSSISNKYSLSKLEKVLGSCPLPTPRSAVPQPCDPLKKGVRLPEQRAEQAAPVKHKKIGILSFFAAVIKFKQHQQGEKQHVYANSTENHQAESRVSEVSQPQQMFVM